MRGKLSLLVLILVLCSLPVEAGLMQDFKDFLGIGTDIEIGETITDGKSVLSDEWASLEVTPSIALSIASIRNFTQTLNVCNKADDSGYFFLDYYFSNPLMGYSMTRVDNWVNIEERETADRECHEIGDVGKGTNETVCSITGTTKFNYTTAGQTKVRLDAPEKKSWGAMNHYVNPVGDLYKASECKQYLLNYKTVPSDSNGKWNFRVWGNTKDDWSCIEKDSCPFDYTLDPSYTTNYSYKQNINITNTGWTINNYTVSLNFSGNNTLNTTHFQGDGDDVLFVNYDETAVLGCYKESFSNSSGGVMNWSVMLTNFTNATPTSIWMYHGNITTNNQFCAEINNAYLLADLMNTTSGSINTTIWNERVGSWWGTSGNWYNATTTVVDFCQGAFYPATTPECDLRANTTGVLKQSQALDIRLRTRLNCSIGGAYAVLIGQNNTAMLGSTNMSWTILDGGISDRIGQNTTALVVKAGMSNAGQTIQQNIWRKTSVPFYGVTVYDWYNSTFGDATEEVKLGSNQPNASVTPNSYLNNSNKLFLEVTDGSGGVGCATNGGIWVDEIRVKAFVNSTPTFVFGEEQDAGGGSPVSLNVTNETWTLTGWETGKINFTVNTTIDQNFYNNISAVNFSYNGTVYRELTITNITSGNSTKFTISIRAPLIEYNTTVFSFNWTFGEQGNGSTIAVGNSSNRTQTILWGYWVNNVTYTSPVASGASNTWMFNLSKMVSDAVPFIHNVTLEYNLTNQTNATLTVNATSYEEYTFTMTAPTVSTTTTVNWTDWHAMNFSPNIVNRNNITSTSWSNGTQTILGINPLRVENETWETTGLFDAGGISNYSINVSIDQMFFNNITSVNFSINGFYYQENKIDNTSSGNWTQFNISVYTPLVQTNATLIGFNWSFQQTGNGTTNASGNSSNRSQSVNWGWYVNNMSYQSPIVSMSPNNLIVNFTKHTLTPVGLYLNVTNEWNLTNRTATILTNISSYEEWNLTFSTPIVYYVTSISTKGWLNISFNGSYVTRDPTFTQVVNPFSNQTFTTPILETSLANFTFNVSNSSPIVNVNFTWNASQFNTSQITNTSSGSLTIFNISIRLPLIPSNQSNYSFRWNATLSNGTIFNTNLTNQTVLINYYPNSIFRNTSEIEGSTQNQIVNITKHLFANGVSELVNLEYNQTNYSAAIYVNGTNYEDWTASFITPFVSVDTLVQERAWLNITQTMSNIENDNYLRNTTNNFTQTITNINVTGGICSGLPGYNAVINFTFFNELGNQSISENGSDQITIWSTLQTSNQTFGFDFVNTTFTELCIACTNCNLTANFNIQFNDNGTTYTLREYWERLYNFNTTFNNTRNITLYNLQLANATEIIFNILDNNDDPIQNMIVQALKYNISNNSYKIVDTELSDFDGKARLHLFVADDYYKIRLIDGNNTIVLDTTLFKLLFTEYFIRVVPVQTDITTVIRLREIPHNLTFDNGTKIISLSWNDIENITSNNCLEIVNTTNASGLIINKQCSTNQSGYFTFNVTNINGTYIAKYVVGDNSFLIDAISVILTPFRNLGREGIWMAFLIIGTLAAIGLSIDPTVSIIFTLLGVVMMTFTGMLPISWLTMSGLVVAGIITALVINKVQ